MVGYWTAFMKTGNPNGGGRPAWPEFTSAHRFMSMNEPAPAAFTEKEFNATHQCDFWNTLTKY